MLEQGDFMIECRSLGANAIDIVKARGDQVIPVLFDKFSNGLGVKFAARHTQSKGELLGRLKDPLRNRNCGFHHISITLVIPTSNCIHLPATKWTPCVKTIINSV